MTKNIIIQIYWAYKYYHFDIRLENWFAIIILRETNKFWSGNYCYWSMLQRSKPLTQILFSKAKIKIIIRYLRLILDQMPKPSHYRISNWWRNITLMPNPPSQIYKTTSLSISSRLTKFYRTNHSRSNMIIILVIPIKLINQTMSISRLLKIKNTLLPIAPNTKK